MGWSAIQRKTLPRFIRQRCLYKYISLAQSSFQLGER